MVRIKIPAGVDSQSILRLQLPKTAKYEEKSLKIRINIEPHPWVERRGLDVTIKIPITVSEAARGAELIIPTLDGQAKVKIPAGWNCSSKIRLKGRGVASAQSNIRGDLYVATHIVPPENWTKTALDALRAVEACYKKSVRDKLPAAL